MADQSIPLKISIAPFPEGFKGDMDETFQQACILMEATVEGQFLTGLILPPGSTLPTTDQGPIAMGGTWYFWNSTTNSYQPQSTTARGAKNYCKNGAYQIQQTGPAPALVAGVNKTYDMTLCRMTTAGVLTIAVDVGPMAGVDYDTCPAAIKYTVGTAVPTLGATDIYAHEHLIEGSDLAPIQGEILSLSFLCWVSQAGTYSAYLASGTRDASYCVTFTMPTASTWTRVKIQGIPAIPAIPAIGTWSYSEGATGMYVGVVMACGSQWQTANTGKWNAGFFGAGTTQSNMVAVTTTQMKITAMRLEASPQCGYAMINSFEADFHDCIRYYFTTFNYQSVTAGISVLGTTLQNANWLFNQLFPRRMCSAPVVTPYGNTSHAAGMITDISLNPPFDIATSTLAATPKGIQDDPAIQVVTTGNTHSTTTVDGIPSTTGLYIGNAVAGTGIPAGATIAAIPSGSSVTISVAATATTTGVALTFKNLSLQLVTTGNTHTTITVDNIPSTTGLAPGMGVVGSGIPAGATIATVASGTSVTLSAATTTTLTGTALTFNKVLKGDNLVAFIVADARLT